MRLGRGRKPCGRMMAAMNGDFLMLVAELAIGEEFWCTYFAGSKTLV